MNISSDAVRFIEAWRVVQDSVADNADRHGWWDGERRPEPEIMCLIHSEISEALEGFRAGNPPDKHIPEYSSIEVELADVVIRIMDYAEHYGYRVADALVEKAAFNETRPYRHGGKAA